MATETQIPTGAFALTRPDLQTFLTGLERLSQALKVIKPGVGRLLRFLMTVAVDDPSLRKAIMRLNKHLTKTDTMIDCGAALAKQQLDHARTLAVAGNVRGVLATVNDGYMQLLDVGEQITKLDVKFRDVSTIKLIDVPEHFPEELEIWCNAYQAWCAATTWLWVAENENVAN